MSTYAVIEGISTELGRQAFDTLAEASSTNFSSMDPGSNIALASPGEDFACQFVVNLSLCHIDAYRPLRNLPPLRTNAAEFHQPSLTLLRRYLITPLDTVTNNYRMSSWNLQHSHTPYISSVAGSPLTTATVEPAARSGRVKKPSPRNDAPRSEGRIHGRFQ